MSGNTARFIDQKASLRRPPPLVVAVVGGDARSLLLFMLTGSVLLPLKTLLMNVLTLAATLGMLVLAFQEGVLDAPLDYTGPAAVEVTSLVFLFAVIFGLATDYAVLVMARIKEQHDLGASQRGGGRDRHRPHRPGDHRGRGDDRRRLPGLRGQPVFFMKQIAVGQAVGVLIDATIVRALLVPSLMRLLGDWNWWAPEPLRRFQARFGFQEA